MYKFLLRPLLFLLDPERVHYLSFSAIRLMHRLGLGPVFRWRYQLNNPDLEREVFGLKFPNPVGLAAGFDKDAKCFRELSSFGFGFIEIGTLTPKPQPGNPKKRLFRLKKDSGIINRMGFNNQGVEAAAIRLQHKGHLLIGGNIGKNKVTPNEQAVDDYLKCFNELFPLVDYFVVNVSSPNTPGLRELQEREPLTRLLNTLMEANARMAREHNLKTRPLLLKIAPDLTDDQLRDIIEIVKETRIDGVIATNTTISREGLASDPAIVNEAGGLSGLPLRERATEVIRFLVQESDNAFPVIGVGGIHSAEDALEKLEAGASLVQLYTGFVYEGPALIRRINQAVLKKKK